MDEDALIQKGYIPLDKSWVIRMGVLDMVNGCPDIIDFLASQKSLSDDLQALLRAAQAWNTNEPIDVGESGTLYRFLRFALWARNLDKKFVIRGTLKDRAVCDNPGIVHYSLKELLLLDHGTSQWASAAVLCGNNEEIKNPPYKLHVTYEARSHWQEQREKNQTWSARYDATILKQAHAFLMLLRGERPAFIAEQAEDYCFARAFDFITQNEGLRRWPSLTDHESNRIETMEKELKNFENKKPVTSRDHRVVEALAMKAAVEGQKIQFEHSEAVAKSWPQFWDFLREASTQYS